MLEIDYYQTQIFQLNNKSQQKDLIECLQWIEEMFQDSSPKIISVIVKKQCRKTPIQAEKSLNNEKIKLKSELLQQQANIFYNNNDYDNSLAQFRASLDVAQQNVEQNSQLIVYNHAYIANILHNQNNNKEAICEYLKALEIVKKNGTNQSSEDFSMQYILHQLGNLYFEEKDVENSIEYWKQACEQIENPENAEDQKLQSHLLNNIGMAYYEKSDLEKAISYFRKSLAIFQNLLKVKEYEDDVNLINSFANRLNNLGETLRKNQKFEEAEKVFKESIKFKIQYQSQTQDFSEEQQKSIGISYHNLGITLFTLKKTIEAIENLNNALQNYESFEGYEVKNAISNIRNQRGECYKQLKQYQKASEDYKEAYNLKEKTLGLENRLTLQVLSNYCQALFVLKQYDLAQEMFIVLLEGQRKVFGENDCRIGQTLNNIGTVLSEKKKYFEAEEYLQRAIVVLERGDNIPENVEKIRKNLKVIQNKRNRL